MFVYDVHAEHVVGVVHKYMYCYTQAYGIVVYWSLTSALNFNFA